MTIAGVAACSGEAPREDAATTEPSDRSRPGTSAGAAGEAFSGVPVLVGDSTLRFPGGGEYTPGFRDVSYLGQIPAGYSAPFIIIRGVECSYCDAPPSVLMRSPSDGATHQLRFEPGWHPYPGRILAPDDSTIVLSEARGFWGECLPGDPPGIFYFRTDFTGGEPSRHEARATVVRGDTLVRLDGQLEWSSLETAATSAASGRCHEIEPLDRPGDF